MKYVEHTVILSSGEGQDVSPAAAARVLDAIGPMVRSSVLMAFEGRGAAKRRPPRWLQDASDVRFRRATSGASMTFVFAVPQLGDAAHSLYEQGAFWDSRPNREDTGFDLVCNVFREVAAENTDSELLDDKVLARVTKFRGVFKSGADRLSFHPRRSKQPITITSATVDAADKLTSSTPGPQAVRLVGNLDMIRVSTQHFAVKLESGDEIGGVFLGGDIKELGSLLDKRVVVSGQVVYRPSGRILRVDAERVIVGDGEGAIWSHIPPPQERPLAARELRKHQGPRTGVAAIIGRWPGDETDEEIDEALAAIS